MISEYRQVAGLGREEYDQSDCRDRISSTEEEKGDECKITEFYN